MITLLYGDNTFEIDQALQALYVQYGDSLERYEGADISYDMLPSLFQGMSLLSHVRTIVIRRLSENKEVWARLPEWLKATGEDTHIFLVEQKLDKRTKTFKELQAGADLKEFTRWKERDYTTARQWTTAEAARRGVALTTPQVRLLVERVGPDQMALHHALEKLSLLSDVTDAVITETIERSPNENVFELFEAVLRGDVERCRQMIATLRQTEDPYMLFGLLATQAGQFLALAAAKSSDTVAKDIGAHPFVLSKLKPYVETRGVNGAKALIEVIAETDRRMKTSSLDPWIAVEYAVQAIARG